MIESLIPLASAAVAALIPYLKEGGESIASEAGKDLYGWLKSKLSFKNKEAELESLKAAPDDQKIQGRLEMVLQHFLEEHPHLVNEFQRIVQAAETNSIKKIQAINIENSKNFIIGKVDTNILHLGDNLSGKNRNE